MNMVTIVVEETPIYLLSGLNWAALAVEIGYGKLICLKVAASQSRTFPSPTTDTNLESGLPFIS